MTTIKIINRYTKGREIPITYTKDEAGRWTMEWEFSPTPVPVHEADVIDDVKRWDRVNLHKYFPMSGFHA